MSLRLRAILTLGLIEFITLAAIISFNLAYSYTVGLQQIEIRARETAILLRTAIGESLMTSNLPSVQEIVDAAFYDILAIDRVVVVNELGEEIARKKRGHALLPGGHVTISEPIELGSVNLGKVTVCYSKEPVTHFLYHKLMIMGSFALLGICISAWVTNVATCKMSVALTELASGMKDMINNRDPIVVEYNKDNELGRLVNSYNELIEKLGK